MGATGAGSIFNSKAEAGFVDAQDGPLKAEANPGFLITYGALLSNHDRVIHSDFHKDSGGLAFISSEKNMNLMRDNDYEYLLLELPPVLNDVVEKYETAETKPSIQDLQNEMAVVMFNYAKEHSLESIVRARGQGLTEKDIFTKMTAGILPVAQLVHNANLDTDNNIKVRFFDDFSKVGLAASDQDKNLHIDNERRRVDAHWDPYIESLTEGKKAVALIGAAHLATSYGIDEYMEARGYNVATFRVHSADTLAHPHINECVSIQTYQNDQIIDTDGYDASDFRPDLVYDERTKEIFENQSFGQNCKPVKEITRPSELPFSSIDFGSSQKN